MIIRFAQVHFAADGRQLSRDVDVDVEVVDCGCYDDNNNNECDNERRSMPRMHYHSYNDMRSYSPVAHRTREMAEKKSTLKLVLNRKAIEALFRTLHQLVTGWRSGTCTTTTLLSHGVRAVAECSLLR